MSRLAAALFFLGCQLGGVVGFAVPAARPCAWGPADRPCAWVPAGRVPLVLSGAGAWGLRGPRRCAWGAAGGGLRGLRSTAAPG